MKVVVLLLMLVSVVSVKSQDEEVIEFVTSSGGNLVAEDNYEFVEKQPEFPGGMAAMQKYLAATIVYPKEEIEKGVQGVVYVKFLVTKSGKIEDIKIIRGISELLDNEAKRAISLMPRWTPGEQAGKKVNVWFTLPVKFQLH